MGTSSTMRCMSSVRSRAHNFFFQLAREISLDPKRTFSLWFSAIIQKIFWAQVFRSRVFCVRKQRLGATNTTRHWPFNNNIMRILSTAAMRNATTHKSIYSVNDMVSGCANAGDCGDDAASFSAVIQFLMVNGLNGLDFYRVRWRLAPRWHGKRNRTIFCRTCKRCKWMWLMTRNEWSVNLLVIVSS